MLQEKSSARYENLNLCGMHANYTPTCKERVAAIAVSWSAKTNVDMQVTGLSLDA